MSKHLQTPSGTPTHPVGSSATRREHRQQNQGGFKVHRVKSARLKTLQKKVNILISSKWVCVFSSHQVFEELSGVGYGRTSSLSALYDLMPAKWFNWIYTVYIYMDFFFPIMAELQEGDHEPTNTSASPLLVSYFFEILILVGFPARCTAFPWNPFFFFFLFFVNHIHCVQSFRCQRDPGSLLLLFPNKLSINQTQSETEGLKLKGTQRFWLELF